MPAANPNQPTTPSNHTPHAPGVAESLEDAVWHELQELKFATTANTSAIGELDVKILRLLRAVNGDDEADAPGLRKRVANNEREISELKEQVRDRAGQQKSRLETVLAYAQLCLYAIGFVVLIWGLATGRFIVP